MRLVDMTRSSDGKLLYRFCSGRRLNLSSSWRDGSMVLIRLDIVTAPVVEYGFIRFTEMGVTENVSTPRRDAVCCPAAGVKNDFHLTIAIDRLVPNLQLHGRAFRIESYDFGRQPKRQVENLFALMQDSHSAASLRALLIDRKSVEATRPLTDILRAIRTTLTVATHTCVTRDGFIRFNSFHCLSIRERGLWE